jgi:hypothetical protein
MKMFIANGTHQNIDFQYRIPEYKNYRQQTIPIGGQIRISGELSPKDVEAIITTHEIYGMVEASKIADFRGWHIPYIYAIGEPINAGVIAELVAHNRVVNTELGMKYRQEAAVALDGLIKDNTKGDKLNQIEMTIEEVDTKIKEPEIHEKVRVTTDRERGASQDPKHPIVENARRSLF